MPRIDPLLEEVFVASIAVSFLGGFIALVFWLFTGLSPWPMLIVAEIGGFGFGVAVLALTSPRRR